MEISRCFWGYKKLMNMRDVGADDFNKSEEHYRDSFYFSLLKNPLLLQANVEFEITKVRDFEKTNVRRHYSV